MKGIRAAKVIGMIMLFGESTLM